METSQTQLAHIGPGQCASRTADTPRADISTWLTYASPCHRTTSTIEAGPTRMNQLLLSPRALIG